jgi:hypothetical protein
MNKRHRQFGILLANIVLYLLSKISDDEYKVVDARLPQLIDDDAEDRFTRQGDQGLWLGVTVGAKAGACPGNGDDGFHVSVSTQNYVFLTSHCHSVYSGLQGVFLCHAKRQPGF